jgi:hypothetical protein
MSLERSGGCLCGSVRFKATLTGKNFGVCHCPMCRKWTGSALLGMTVPAANVVWTGAEHIAKRQSSGWGERAWCRDCGSPVWFRVTVDSPYSGTIELPIGSFDDANGLTMANEIYIDHKPDSYAFAGEGRKVLTRADCVALFPLLASEDADPS